MQDTVPTQEELSWQDFVSIFSTDPVIASCSRASCARSTCPHKQIACWSPAVASSISLLVFDVNFVTDAQLYEVRGRIGGYRHLIHATHSDRPDSRCVRIVIALSRPVPRETWPVFWRLAQTIVPIADACGDPDRIYFLPSVSQGVGYFILVNEGALLDVDATLAIAAASDHVASVTESEAIP